MKSLLLLVLIFVAATTAGQQADISVKSLMTVAEFNAAGLNKLSQEELKALDKWFVKTVITLAQRSSSSTGTAVSGSYPVEASVNDETFIVNGEVFKAKTYCFNVNKGDRVKFVDGSASGACASVKFVDLTTGDVCEVWCE